MAPLGKIALAGACAVLSAHAQDYKYEVPVATKDTWAPEPQYKERKSEPFVEVAPIAVCPDGSFSTAGCATIVTADASYSCPHPYKMDKVSNTCTATTFAKPTIYCPKGAVEHKKKCLTTETAPLEHVCPKKTTETKDGCQYPGKEGTPDVEVEPKFTCPKGSKLEHDQCVSVEKVDGELVCDKGFELYGKKCVSRIPAPYECKKGEYHDGRCVFTETVPQTVVCPKKANYEGKGCAVVETSAPAAVCDKGYVLEGKYCYRKVIITAQYENNMKKDDVATFKCTHKTDEHGNCYTVEKTKPAPVCPKGADLKGKKCVTVTVLAPEYGCPKKYEPSGKGQCVKITETKPKCPKGYKSADGQCWKTVAESPAFYCPPGTDGDKGKCKKAISVPAAAVCPKKASMDKSGRCIYPGKPGEPGQIVAPKSYCPKGFHQMTDGCVRDVSSAGEYTCDKGFVLHKKKCVAEHSIAPIMMCPKGYVSVKGGVCSKTSYEHPTFVCPDGSTGKGKKCYQAAPQKKMYEPMPVKSAPSPLKKLGPYSVDEAAVEEAIDDEFGYYDDIETQSINELGYNSVYYLDADAEEYYDAEADGEL
jgi:hypothetical protein